MTLSPFDADGLPLIGAVIPPDPILGAAMFMHDPDRPAVTVDEALALLPENRPNLSVFVGDFGESWAGSVVRFSIANACALRLAGAVARSAGHGLMVSLPDGRSLLVETDRTRVAALLAARAQTPTPSPDAGFSGFASPAGA